MLRIDGMSRTPVYEQIVEQVERLVNLGIMKAGEQLPSVRSLSVELSVNPNTIQKAYSELDARGIVRSVPGKGCFVSEEAAASLKEAGVRNLAKLTELAHQMYISGVSKEDIMKAVETAFSPADK